MVLTLTQVLREWANEAMTLLGNFNRWKSMSEPRPMAITDPLKDAYTIFNRVARRSRRVEAPNTRTGPGGRSTSRVRPRSRISRPASEEEALPPPQSRRHRCSESPVEAATRRRSRSPIEAIARRRHSPPVEESLAVRTRQDHTSSTVVPAPSKEGDFNLLGRIMDTLVRQWAAERLLGPGVNGSGPQSFWADVEGLYRKHFNVE